MKSILNERTGENPSTKLRWSLRLSFLWASNLSCLMPYQQMQLEASKTLPACCWFYGMKIRDDRIANYSFHSVSLGGREYPEQSQLLSPFLSITRWEPSYLPLQQLGSAFPPTQRWLRVQHSLWTDGKAKGKSQMQAHPPTLRQSRGRCGFLLFQGFSVWFLPAQGKVGQIR